MSNETHEIRPNQSIELLKELHILTHDDKMNQDSRRKPKQVYHLFQFIEPLMASVQQAKGHVTLTDHGTNKSYLGFILHDLFCKEQLGDSTPHIYGIETREELVAKSTELVVRLGFEGMSFLSLSVMELITSDKLPGTIDIVTALHAYNTAMDGAIRFALEKYAQYIVFMSYCQAEVAGVLRKNKGKSLGNTLAEIWRHPLYAHELGSQVIDVLYCLRLEAHGYQASMAEPVEWEHSMKNELIIVHHKDLPHRRPTERLNEVISTLEPEELHEQFFVPVGVWRRGPLSLCRALTPVLHPLVSVHRDTSPA